MTHPTDGYQPVVPEGVHNARPPRSRVDESHDLRTEILEEAAKLHRIIRGRTLGRDVCLDQEEARDLLDKLDSWATRV